MALRFLPIFKKEFKLFLQAPSLYVVLGFFFAAGGIFFQDILVFYSRISTNPQMRYMMGFGELDQTQFVVGNAFSLINFLFLFVIPIITMRLFAEERRSGTFELLITYPFKDWDIILGKYLAGVAVVLAILIISLAYPLTLFWLGNPEPMVILSCYAGLLLVAMAYLAFGLFASSLTDSQIVAAIVTFIGLLVLYLIGDLSAAETGFLGRVFDNLSMRVHSMNFTRGSIELKDIAYFILFSVFFLFGTAKVLESRHWRV